VVVEVPLAFAHEKSSSPLDERSCLPTRRLEGIVFVSSLFYDERCESRLENKSKALARTKSARKELDPTATRTSYSFCGLAIVSVVS